MRIRSKRILGTGYLLPSALLFALGLGLTTFAQDGDLVRISTSLVQTGVSVFDKQGHFIEGLGPEQFELLIDGKPKPISFLEQVVTGSSKEKTRLSERREGKTPASPALAEALSQYNGRTIIFFVDDLHLSPDSIVRTRQMLLHFIDDQMGQNDQMIVASASGRIGFLQQLTDNKDVLHAAAGRLKYVPIEQGGAEHPPMTEYEAFSIQQGDEKVLEHFIAFYLSLNPGMRRTVDMRTTRANAQRSVEDRARRIMHQSEFTTKNTLSVLENVMHSSSQLPGRKLLFLVSDGFLANTRDQSSRNDLDRIVATGLRSNVVVYSLQASGLRSSYPDASSGVFVDDNAEISTSFLGEDTARQDPLYTVAKGTGGRAFFNSNSLDDGISRAVTETGRYYLLGWYPENENSGSTKFDRIEIKLRNHPEWKLLMQRGFYTRDNPDGEVNGKPGEARSADDMLSKTLGALYPRPDLPVSLSVIYLQTPKSGAVASILTQVSTAGLAPISGPDASTIDLAGIVFDDKGKPASSFRDRLSVSTSGAPASPQKDSGVVQATQAPLKPGLYQVRVAARHDKTGKAGSASQWIVIPDFKTNTMSLGSLFLGEVARDDNAGRTSGEALQKALMSVDHHFAQNSHLRFSTYVYNASQAAAAPDVVIEGKIFRGDQIFISMPVQKIDPTGVADLTRLPYAEEFSLERFPPGRYLMIITATDRKTKITSSQRVSFWVE